MECGADVTPFLAHVSNNEICDTCIVSSKPLSARLIIVISLGVAPFTRQDTQHLKYTGEAITLPRAYHTFLIVDMTLRLITTRSSDSHFYLHSCHLSIREPDAIHPSARPPASLHSPALSTCPGNLNILVLPCFHFTPFKILQYLSRTRKSASPKSIFTFYSDSILPLGR